MLSSIFDCKLSYYIFYRYIFFDLFYTEIKFRDKYINISVLFNIVVTSVRCIEVYKG